MSIPLNIVGNAENYLTLTGLRDQNGNAVANTSVAVAATVADKNGSTVLGSTAVPWVGTASDGTGIWGLSVAASVWVPGNGPWTVHLIVTDPGGATVYHDFACNGVQGD